MVVLGFLAPWEMIFSSLVSSISNQPPEFISVEKSPPTSEIPFGSWCGLWEDCHFTVDIHVMFV